MMVSGSNHNGDNRMPSILKIALLFILRLFTAVYIVPLLFSLFVVPAEVGPFGGLAVLCMDAAGGALIGFWSRGKYSVWYAAGIVCVPLAIFLDELRTYFAYGPPINKDTYKSVLFLGPECGSNECMVVALITLPLLCAFSYLVSMIVSQAWTRRKARVTV
jgi:hypothetical protein